ncbi:SRPBCC family protein [Lapillicoccus jejuensis]|uniref:Carbon monoxide dehydrogenase subunit G n=1 Tax=Lapillicoccus jejuensis TaxID=402171 RepID=A0A542DW96_9MICO|nr:SRPBCC family protein [Lapillicoccus jejuensis]TQJ07371.1 carbon monoxide dehydrogenase subunit G [Lapillicoccus jejuensis]
MAAVVRRTVDAPVDRVWATVTDFAGYGRWIPLTRMRTDPGEPRVGWQFGGFTGLGPVGFLDSMLVTVWEPPADGVSRATFSVRKTGYVLAGWADVVLEPRDAGTRTQLTWTEEIVPRPVAVGRLLAAVADPLTERLFGRAVDAMAAEAAQAGRPA